MAAKLHQVAENYYAFHCPGCQYGHAVTVNGHKNSQGASWGWNGSMDKPTFTPSINIRTGLYAGSVLVDENDKENFPVGKEWNDMLKRTSVVCHSVVTAGNIHYMADSTHALSGQIVELPDL